MLKFQFNRDKLRSVFAVWNKLLRGHGAYDPQNGQSEFESYNVSQVHIRRSIIVDCTVNTLRWSPMAVSYIQTNPLIQSVVHRPFQRAISEIGLPALTEPIFRHQIKPYLQSVGIGMDESPWTLDKLWKSILCGEVIATEVDNESWPVFYVRGGFGGRGIDVRLTCREQEWNIVSVTAIYARPILRSRWFHRSSFAVAVVCAAMIGYAIHQPSQVSVSPPPAPVTAATVPSTVNKPPLSVSQGRPSSSKLNVGNLHARNIAFTLSQGMPLYNLSKFLQAQHLVKDAMSFDMVMKQDGVDRGLKPGVYRFKSDMTQSDIIQVLRQGPTM